MIKLDVRTPAPNILGMTDDMFSVKEEFSHKQGMTLGGLIKEVGRKYPSFKAKLQRNPNLLADFVLTIDDVVADTTGEMDTPVGDGCVVMIVSPYRGG